MNLNKNQDNQEKIDIEEVNSEEQKSNQESIEIEEKYRFGWSDYSEKTNGRFAMLGFLAIILIELFSQQSFLAWAGLLS